jgi:hypothetical protein
LTNALGSIHLSYSVKYSQSRHFMHGSVLTLSLSAERLSLFFGQS